MMIGGMYAKAKQRVLNRIGKRTTLTRNPRVDFISKRVEEIKAKKARVTHLSNAARHQMKQAVKSLTELDRMMLDAFRDELGERKWSEEKGTYSRVLHTEEKRLVADMERVFSRCRETLDKVVDTYVQHLDDTAEKPLTYNTPDEASRLSNVMQTKEEYKHVRTTYSDAMIDLDAELGTGSNASSASQQKVDDAKKAYDEMSERLCEDALKYERIYREELAQRVSAHFMAEQHLLRGVSSAMKDFMPYTRGLTLDWEELRNTRRANLTAAKTGRDMEDEEIEISDRLDNLPIGTEQGKRDGLRANKSSSSNPFEGIASDISATASAAGSAIATAGKSTSKSIAGLVASYSTKPSSKS